MPPKDIEQANNNTEPVVTADADETAGYVRCDTDFDGVPAIQPDGTVSWLSTVTINAGFYIRSENGFVVCDGKNYCTHEEDALAFLRRKDAMHAVREIKHRADRLDVFGRWLIVNAFRNEPIQITPLKIIRL